jgi:hypothetical protein
MGRCVSGGGRDYAGRAPFPAAGGRDRMNAMRMGMAMGRCYDFPGPMDRPSNARPVLLLPERAHGVHPGGSQRWDQAGEEGHDHQEQGRHGYAERVRGTDAV